MQVKCDIKEPKVLIENPTGFMRSFIRFAEDEGADSTSDLSWWLATCQRARRGIRKLFNDHLKIETNITVPATNINELVHLESMILMLGEYYDNGDEEVLEMIDIARKLTPNLNVKHTDRGMSTTRFLAKNNDKFGDYSHDAFAKLNSLLGMYYGLTELEEESEFKLVLDTTAMGTLRLGHYDVDDGSCFGQYRECCNNKYNFGMLDGSFVGLLYDEYDNLVQRFLGVYRDDDSFYLVNFYRHYEKYINVIIYIFNKLIRRLTGKEYKCFGCNLNIEDVYTNPTPRLHFTDVNYNPAEDYTWISPRSSVDCDDFYDSTGEDFDLHGDFFDKREYIRSAV